jgi:hypothetical protein
MPAAVTKTRTLTKTPARTSARSRPNHEALNGENGVNGVKGIRAPFET